MPKIELVNRDELTHFAKPTGWFVVGWTHEHPSGSVTPMKYFGADLVMYRTEHGTLVVSDAHCPHFGAHLGYGGTVEEECIRCPFHGWTWGPNGQNVSIPYSEHRNKSKRLRHWPVREQSGMIFLWHSVEGETPQWEPPVVPEFDGADFFSPYPEGCRLHAGARLWPQFMIENNVDYAHLKYVHEWDTIPRANPVEERDHIFTTSFDGYINTKQGEKKLEIVNDVHGVGVIVTRISGLRATVSVTAVTPVDDYTSDVRLTVTAERRPEDPESPTPAVVEGIRRAQLVTAYRQDEPIWENMKYNVTPPYPREEAHDFVRFRKWSERFYPLGAPYRYE